MSVLRIRRVLVPRLISFCLASSLLLTGAPAAIAGRAPAPTGEERVIVELADADVSLMSQAADSIAKAVDGAAVERSYRTVLRGLSVRVPDASPTAMARISALPGVQRVYRERVYQPALFESVSTINADGLWPSSGGQAEAGRGVRIAVIDSGIGAHHPALSDAGYPTQLPTGFPRGDVSCTTNKVIAARAYFRPADPPCSSETLPIPGENGSYHGTAMAGIAAGSVVKASYDGLSLSDYSGVAPGAYLMNYRVFYPTEPGAAEYAYTTEILAAIEDAIDDGADVILNCWTSVATTAPADSAVAVALQAAMDAGCAVVAPAGNEGSGEGSASLLPGGIADVLTVGAVRKARIAVPDTLDVVGPAPVPDALTGIRFGRASYGPQVETLSEGLPFAAVPDIETNGYLCEPITTTELVGKVALARRGECDFLDKTLNAQAITATALIAINNEGGYEEMGCDGAECGNAAIPSVMIGSDDGAALLARLDSQPDSTLTSFPETRIVAEDAGVLWPKSAQGPAYMRSLKPELVAPGVEVLAPIYPSDTGQAYGLVSGTSAAAAHVAGAAALLKARHATWGHAEVKGALVGSATTDGLSSTDVNAVGAGLPDVVAADSAPLLAIPAALAVPSLSASASQSITVTLSDKGSGGGSTAYQVTSASSPTIQVQHQAAISVPRGESAVLTLNVSALPGAETGSAQATITVTGRGASIDIPLWAFVQPAPDPAEVLVIDNDFSEFEGYRHYTNWITETLDTLGVSYATINPDLVYDEPNSITLTLDSLLTYDAIIWHTGDNQNPDGYYVPETPLTVADQQLLAAYLDGGGRLLAMGQNLSSASDVNSDPDATWGRSPLYHGYLGAHWVKGELYGSGQYPPSSGPAVVGAPGTFLSGMQLHMGQWGDGAGNQISVDEIAPGGSPVREDADLTQAVLVAVDGFPAENGYVAVAKSQEPTMDEPDVDIPYRSLHFAFGFEGINTVDGMTTRAEVMDASLDWLLDEVSVSIAPITSSVYTLVPITCQAASTRAQGAMSYRWRVGEGAAAWETTSTQPTISAMFYQTGTVPVIVEATDSLGHTAVAYGEIDILEGGGCTMTVDSPGARPGEIINYDIELSNSAPFSTSASFEMVRPATTTYVESYGGTWTGGALIWSGTLGPESLQSLRLSVRVNQGAATGTEIVGTGSFVVGSRAFEISRTTRVGSLIMLPAVLKY